MLNYIGYRILLKFDPVQSIYRRIHRYNIFKVVRSKSKYCRIHLISIFSIVRLKSNDSEFNIVFERLILIFLLLYWLFSTHCDFVTLKVCYIYMPFIYLKSVTYALNLIIYEAKIQVTGSCHELYLVNVSKLQYNDIPLY